MRQMIEVLKGKYNRDMTFKDTIDLAASISVIIEMLGAKGTFDPNIIISKAAASSGAPA